MDTFRKTYVARFIKENIEDYRDQLEGLEDMIKKEEFTSMREALERQKKEIQNEIEYLEYDLLHYYEYQ